MWSSGHLKKKGRFKYYEGDEDSHEHITLNEKINTVRMY